MVDQPDNQQKCENYRAQSRRLASALRSGFYLEAVTREGEALVKTLKSNVGSFNRAVDRERAKGEANA